MDKYLVIVEVSCYDEDGEDFGDTVEWIDDVVVKAKNYDEAKDKAVSIVEDTYTDVNFVLVKAIEKM